MLYFFKYCNYIIPYLTQNQPELAVLEDLMLHDTAQHCLKFDLFGYPSRSCIDCLFLGTYKKFL